VAIFLTGGTGFIGRHVRKVLHDRDIGVTLLSRSNRVEIFENEALLHGDLSVIEPSLLSGITVLIHLAWDGLSDFFSEDHVEKVLPAQREFFDAASRSDLEQLVVAGTCLEYGPHSGALREDFPTHPSVSYARAKDELHQHLRGVLPVEKALTWCRIFYPYGPGQSPTSLYSSVIHAGRTGQPLHMSHGQQRRDFLRVERIAEILVDLSIGISFNGIVNVGSGVPLTVVDLVSRILEEEGLSVTEIIRDLQIPEYEHHDFWANTAMLNRLLAASS
jgi:dTDP-6-deoxy-L-talose 4-dehydrogenase (NAD+)